jgi:hypothetical protein
MKYNVITIAHSTAKKFRDGFGINQEGELFLVITKTGIEQFSRCLIFTFTENGIQVSIENVNIETKYFVDFKKNTSQLIIQDFHFQIVKEMENLYKSITPNKKGALKYTGNTINDLIQKIVKYVYSKVEKYLRTQTNLKVSRKGIKLKYRGYGNFCKFVEEYNKQNDKALVV